MISPLRRTPPIQVPMLAGALALLAAAALPGRAGAQARVVDFPSPTSSLYVPGGVIAGDADATAVALNPGQLGLVEMASTAVLASHWNEDVAYEGRGVGALMTSPLVINGLTMGAGLEWLLPSDVEQTDDYFKLSLGGGLRLGRGLGFGALWQHLFRSRYGGLDGLSLGLGWQPASFLAAGLAVRDVLRPRPVEGGPRLPREWDGEVAVRPTGSPRLELAVGARMLEGDDETRFLPHGRLSVGVYPGVHLFADVQAPRARYAFLDPAALDTAPQEIRGSVGLTVSLDRASFTAAGIGTWVPDPNGGESAHTPGGSLMARSYFNRRTALFSFGYIARVKLGGLEGDRSFIDAMMALRRLGDDPAVGGLLLQIDHLDLGFGRIEEMRALLVEIGKRKSVFAWVTNPDTNEYYLASAASRVVMHPAGGLFLGGLAQTTTFFQGTMDRLGVAVDLVRIAEYKGAMEPFVFPEQSPPVRENRNAILDDLYQRLLAHIGQSRKARGLQPSALPALVDQALFTPAEAKDRALVDEVADERQMEKFVDATLGKNVSIRDADFGRRETGRWRPNRVAVILIDGAITDGRPRGFPPVQGTVAWADPILDALAAVRRDSSVRAVVLRVNSPGGSAFASDRIAREVQRLRESRKPVIVSMGDTAASGGYYVAAPGDEIIAAPSVITGSIGIYAFKLDVAGLAAKLGLNTETVSRGARADLYSMFRGWNDGERQAMFTRMDYHYRQFLRTVAAGRKQKGISEHRADQLGKGKIYTGAQALPLGLVDRLGSVTDAIDEAARRGRVPVGAGGLPEVVMLPQAPADPLETLLALRRLIGSAGTDQTPGATTMAPGAGLTDFLARHGRAAARLLFPLLVGEASGIEARLPYEMTIK